MGRRTGIPVLLLLMAALLCSCSFHSGDDLYALPKTSVEYDSLRSSIQVLLDSGMEYAAPLSGTNTQQVQDVDLDGDGVSEVVAFFRSTTGLQVSVFWQNAGGEYEEMTTITGQGSAVNSVAYAQLDGTENKEIVLTWQISSGVYAMSAYGVSRGSSVELLAPKNYSRYSIVNLDGDGKDELILLQLDASDEGNNRAEYYCWQDGGMAKQGEALLSKDLSVIDHVRSSSLRDGAAALYVTGYVADGREGNSSTQLTDILTLRDGMLVNVTWNDSAASSLSTRRRLLVSDQDLDGDGVWEIPILSSLYERLDGGEVAISDTFYLVTWIQFDRSGERYVQCSTYFNSSDGWYLVIPEEWNNQVALARRDNTLGSTAERSMEFYALEPADPGQGSSLEENSVLGRSVLTNTNAGLFMTIYKNTGTDRVRRTTLEGRAGLNMDTEDTTYCVELKEDNPFGWTVDTVRENLHIITTNWSND